nr:uncharacterized protein LOC109180602 isoform X3 [Ipomoea batatas]
MAILCSYVLLKPMANLRVIVAYSQEAPIVTVFPDGGTINQQFEPVLDPNLAKNTVPVDTQSNCRSHIKQKMNNTENYATYVDVDIEKGKLEVPKAKCADETAGSLKMEDSLVRILQREITSQLGGKFMQLLMNNSLELPKLISRDKCVNEKSYDMSTNRLRKYKRSASFNSRRVVLLFSILSSMGTLVLIYLTLRVK